MKSPSLQMHFSLMQTEPPVHLAPFSLQDWPGFGPERMQTLSFAAWPFGHLHTPCRHCAPWVWHRGPSTLEQNSPMPANAGGGVGITKGTQKYWYRLLWRM